MKRFTVELRDLIPGGWTFAVVFYDDLRICQIRDAVENERRFEELSKYDQRVVYLNLVNNVADDRREFWREFRERWEAA